MRPYLILSLLIFFFTSCDYYASEVPLSNSKNSTIDTLLLGKWIVESDNNEKGDLYIYPFDKKSYLVSYCEIKYDSLNGLQEELWQFKMHNTDIGGYTYYNFQPINFNSNSKELFGVLKLEVIGNRLVAQMLNDELDTQFVSSADFKNYAEFNIEAFNNSFDSLFVIERDTGKMRSFYE